MRVGIIGLPRVGKTTVLGALTGAHAAPGGYRGGEGVSLGVVKVPDERMARLQEIYSPQRTVFATIEFEDIPGVFAHLSGEKGSGAAVGTAREADALLLVSRAFDSPYVAAPLGKVDPEAEHNAMKAELLLADLQVIENRLAAIAASMRKPGGHENLVRESELLERCRRAIEEERDLLDVRMTAAEEKMLRSYAFLTLKPQVRLLNVGEDLAGEAAPMVAEGPTGPPSVRMCALLEKELMELEEDDRDAFLEDAGLSRMAGGDVIRACFDAAGLCTFFTAAPNEVRSWITEADSPAPRAAGKVHTDMEKGFIRAEVIAFDDLDRCGTAKDARAAGKVRMEGKDYVVQDGDIITFHFSS